MARHSEKYLIIAVKIVVGLCLRLAVNVATAFYFCFWHMQKKIFLSSFNLYSQFGFKLFLSFFIETLACHLPWTMTAADGVYHPSKNISRYQRYTLIFCEALANKVQRLHCGYYHPMSAALIISADSADVVFTQTEAKQEFGWGKT